MSKKRVKVLTYDSLVFESRLNMWLSTSKKDILDIKFLSSYDKALGRDRYTAFLVYEVKDK